MLQPKKGARLGHTVNARRSARLEDRSPKTGNLSSGIAYDAQADVPKNCPATESAGYLSSGSGDSSLNLQGENCSFTSPPTTSPGLPTLEDLPPEAVRLDKPNTFSDDEVRNYVMKSVTSEERRNWKGWCDVESEPAFFNLILRDFGVTDVKVQEVISLDKEMLSLLPQPSYGLIFLFQFQEDDQARQELACPEHVWFANQTTNNACGSIALLNIVMNVPDLHLGEVVEQLRDFSMPLTPANRGYVISNHEYIREIHNSFTRKMDMLNADLALSNEAYAKKGMRGSKARKRWREEERDPGFHFVAFLPIQGNVWKLDGLDRQPVNLGELLGDWMDLVRPVIEDRMQRYEGEQIQFSLLSLCKSPLITIPDQLAVNIRSLCILEAGLSHRQPDWSQFIDEKEWDGILRGPGVTHEVTADQLGAAVIPQSFLRLINDPDTSISQLFELRRKLVGTQSQLRVALRDEILTHEREHERAMARRHDYTPFITAWLEMLAKKELLKDICKRVAPEYIGELES